MNSARGSYLFLLITLLVLSGQELMGQSQQEILIGEVTERQLVESNRIFEIYEDRYDPDDGDIEYLKSIEGDYSLMVYFGSWCRESTKYIPGLVKTMRLAGNDQIRVNYIGVDQEKKIPDELLKLFDIKYIPTVVVLKDGKEVGKIVEKTQLPIETELVRILKRQQEN